VVSSQNWPVGQFASVVHCGPGVPGMHVDRESQMYAGGQSEFFEHMPVSLQVPSGPQ
jgi:hypothetical protein